MNETLAAIAIAFGIAICAMIVAAVISVGLDSSSRRDYQSHTGTADLTHAPSACGLTYAPSASCMDVGYSPSPSCSRSPSPSPSWSPSWSPSHSPPREPMQTNYIPVPSWSISPSPSPYDGEGFEQVRREPIREGRVKCPFCHHWRDAALTHCPGCGAGLGDKEVQ